MNHNGEAEDYHEERCFCQDKEESDKQSESEQKEEEERRKTSIKWADWEGGQELQHVKQETPWPEDKETFEDNQNEESIYQNGETQNGNHIDEQLPAVTLAQVKFEPSKSCIVGCVAREHDSLAVEDVPEESLPDTIEAHLELIRERESKQKMKDEVWDQDNPFRPEGELAKEADVIVGAIKEGRNAITPPPPHSPPLTSLSPSSANELDGDQHTLGLDSPDAVDRAMTQEYQTSPTAGTKEAAVVKVERSVIVTSKTEDVEHVVIPEKSTSCCSCAIL